MLTEDDIQSHADRIRDDGYTVIEHAASADLVEGLKRTLERIEREHNLGHAKTSFEGFKTVRINNLLTYDELFWEVPLHENVLPIVERVLDKECLLSSFCSLTLGPGQEAQPIHEDTQLIPLPRPHLPITLNAIWALSDFTADNGATRIIPGSHKYDHSPEYGKEYDALTATMPAGSVIARCGMAAVPTSATAGALPSPAPIAGAGCGSRRICSSASPKRWPNASHGACRNCAATASTRGNSATSTITIRSSFWAANAAGAWSGKQPTSRKQGWLRSSSRLIRHSGAMRQHRTRNLEVPGSRVQRAPERRQRNPNPSVETADRSPYVPRARPSGRNASWCIPPRADANRRRALPSIRNRASARDATASTRRNRRCR